MSGAQRTQFTKTMSFIGESISDVYYSKIIQFMLTKRLPIVVIITFLDFINIFFLRYWYHRCIYYENQKNYVVPTIQQEFEEEQRIKERQEELKRQQDREDLLAAKAYQERVKVQRQEEEQRLEDEFKMKMMEKFAEDDRIEQMNQQRRRMKELEHKREVE